MKVAIITGATSGIGREAALLIDERFDSLDEIWIVGRNEEKLDELSELLRHSVRTFAMDLTKDTELDAFEAVVAKLNPNIRMLFNCAGAGLHGYFHEMNRLEETEMIRLNCESLTTMTAICIPYEKRGAYSSICFHCSLCSVSRLCSIRSNESICVEFFKGDSF